MSNPLLSKLQTEIKAFNNPVYFTKSILNLPPRIEPYPMQKRILNEFYQPKSPYDHMVLVCGMRSGKTQLGAFATTYELFCLIMLGDPQKYYGIAPGTTIFLLHVANSRQQAQDTIYSQTAGLLENADWFWDHGMKERANEFYFPEYNITLRCDHSNSASLAGRTAKMVVLDETARFKDNNGKFSGDAVYFTVSRAVQTFGHQGHVFSVSSPIWDQDFQMRLYRTGLDMPNFLCYKEPTWIMNPNITREQLNPEFKLNPETAWRDYGAKPPAAQEAFFRDPISVRMRFENLSPILLEEDEPRIKPGVLPKKGCRYYLAGDPALKNDAFGLAMVHLEGRIMIVDFTTRFYQTEEEPEIDALKVRKFIEGVSKVFPLRCFVVDTWMFPETVQAIERSGVYVEQNVVKKEQYDLLKEYIYTGNIKIPVNEILLNELLQLELHRGIRVDHPRDGSKDVADALANAVWYCHEEEGVKPEVWVPNKAPQDFVMRLPIAPPIDESEFHEIPL